MSKTAMAVAFSEAGYRTPEAQLDAIAHEAWRKWSAKEMGGARRGHVLNALRGERTFALIERFRPAVLAELVGELLTLAHDEIAAQQPQRKAAPAAGGGQLARDTHGHSAPATPSGAEPDRDRGHVGRDTHVSPAPVAPPANHAATVEAKAAVMRRMSQLDLIIVNAQPLRVLRVGEARGWAAKRGIEARFIGYLTMNMPDHWVIGDHVTGDEADAIYAKAEADYAAAA